MLCRKIYLHDKVRIQNKCLLFIRKNVKEHKYFKILAMIKEFNSWKYLIIVLSH